MSRYLFLCAHPDDLEFYCSNLIRALAAKQGNHVAIASMTRGQRGIPGTPSETYPLEFIGPRLGRIRSAELRRAAALNGVTDVHFLGLSDGEVRFVPSQVAIVKRVIDNVKPDMVFAPEPYWTFYYHQDHIRLGYLARHVLKSYPPDSRPALYFYTTFKPTFSFPFTRVQKRETFLVLEEHKSQHWLLAPAKSLFRVLARVYGLFVPGWPYAEGYRRCAFSPEEYLVKSLADRVKRTIAAAFERVFQRMFVQRGEKLGHAPP